jgi:hypothetical protein
MVVLPCPDPKVIECVALPNEVRHDEMTLKETAFAGGFVFVHVIEPPRK